MKKDKASKDLISIHTPINADMYEDELDIKKDLISVFTQRIEKDITSDHILAYFDKEKDKIYIMEMAYAAKCVLSVMADSYAGWIRYYKMNRPNGESEMPEEMHMEIKRLMEATYGLFSDKIAYLSALNRNKKGNPLVEGILNINGLTGTEEDDEKKESKSVKEIKKALANKEKDEEKK